MARVCAVTFTRHGRLYYVDPGPHPCAVGALVLVPTAEGPELAQVVWAPQEVAGSFGELPVVAGPADDAAVERDAQARRRRAEARVLVKRLVRQHDLPMKVVGVDYVPERRTFTVYFTAPHRVDFRAVVRDSARELQAKVLLTQLSARDGARAQGGIGPCGRDQCCSSFLKDFEPVSLRMATDQDLPLNPLKISGACGKLLCCLKYEHPLYQDFYAAAPALGATVDTPEGTGVVTGHNVPADTVTVTLAGSGRRCACAKASVCAPRLDHDEAYPAALPT